MSEECLVLIIILVLTLIYFTVVLCHSQEYFTRKKGTSIMVGGNWAELRGNPYLRADGRHLVTA